MDFMKPILLIDKWLEKISGWMLVFLLGIMIVMAFGQVILRNFFDSSIEVAGSGRRPGNPGVWGIAGQHQRNIDRLFPIAGIFDNPDHAHHLQVGL